MIPQRMIDEVRQGTDIVDVVSDYVKLNPSGRHYKALSPFTQEKTPSFIVSPDKQIFKCFSSGKGGNVFSFVMEMEKVTFPEAVELLAKRAGIDVSKYRQEGARKDEQRQDSRFDTLRWAARFFHGNLESDAGKRAYAYLAGSRGLEAGTIRRFGLGFAPESWDHLLHASTRDNIPVEHLTELGLLTRHHQRNTLYDTLRNRVIFPIFTIGGQVAGFGGRTLSDDPETPKYINSPESATFEKSKLLYGMHAAKDEIRRQEAAILVEGYMDVIALHQAGITNAVASCGTALTRYQAKILKRYTSRVLFLYDGDNAGKKSMLAGIDILLSEGLTPWVLLLPGGEDPDSFIRNRGKEAFFKEMQDNRTPFLDFQLRCFRDAGMMDAPDQASKAVSAMTRSISLVPDPVQKELYLDELSRQLGISRKTLLKVMPSADSGRPSGPPPREEEKKAAAPAPPPNRPLSVSERTFLEALLESTFYGNEVLAFAASHEQMLSLSNHAAQAVLRHLVDRFRELDPKAGHGIDITAEITSISMPEARDLALDILFRLPVQEQAPLLPDQTMQHARRCLSHFLIAVKTLVLEPLQQEKQTVLAQLAGTTEKADEKKLFMRLHELNSKIRSMDQEVTGSINAILEREA
ncbi:MAG: DNA primase [Chlorobiaceae bacterium]|nr:DNA primase [Chlorobiaceae bacterium]